MESSLDQRKRKDEEKADYIKERQIRLGHVPAPEPQEEEKPKSKSKSKKKAEQEA